MVGYRPEIAFMPHLSQPAMRGGFILAAGLAVTWSCGVALALPPDPQRPFEARTCAEAKARHHETQAGSPLISQAENAAVLAQAVDQMLRLCGFDVQIPAPEKTQDRPKQVPGEPELKDHVLCQL